MLTPVSCRSSRQYTAARRAAWPTRAYTAKRSGCAPFPAIGREMMGHEPIVLALLLLVLLLLLLNELLALGHFLARW